METQTRNSPETASLAGPEKSPRMILKPGTDKSRKKLLVLRSFTLYVPIMVTLSLSSSSNENIKKRSFLIV